MIQRGILLLYQRDGRAIRVYASCRIRSNKAATQAAYGYACRSPIAEAGLVGNVHGRSMRQASSEADLCVVYLRSQGTLFGTRPGRHFSALDRNGRCHLSVQRLGTPEISDGAVKVKPCSLQKVTFYTHDCGTQLRTENDQQALQYARMLVLRSEIITQVNMTRLR